MTEQARKIGVASPDRDLGFRTIKDANDIVAPRLRSLYDYWTKRRGTARFAPPVHDYMLEFPADAPLWSISDVCDGGEDFAYRFAGTAICDLVGLNPTGKRLSDLLAAKNPSVFGINTFDILKLVFKSGLPVLNGPKQVGIEDKTFLCLQSLNLPLGGDGPFPQKILAAAAFIRTAPVNHPE